MVSIPLITDLSGFPQDSNDSVVGAAHEDEGQDENENLKLANFKDRKYFWGLKKWGGWE